jgi:uncharacterized delta-60 repeat protein
MSRKGSTRLFLLLALAVSAAGAALAACQIAAGFEPFFADASVASDAGTPDDAPAATRDAEETGSSADVAVGPASFCERGRLDTSFGDGGVVRVPSTAGILSFRSLAVQSDGRILLGGTMLDAIYRPAQPVVVRLNPDGSVDPSFRTTLAPQPTQLVIGALLPRTDGKIIAAEGSWDLFADPLQVRYAGQILRLNADGSVDTAWPPVVGKAIGIDSQSRLWVARDTSDGGTPSMVVARYDRNGAVDPTLGTLPLPTYGDVFALGPADGLTMADSTGAGTLSRMLSNGSADPSFGSDGRVFGLMRSVALVPTSSELLVLYGGSGVMLHANGTRDPTWGELGSPVVALPDGDNFISASFDSSYGTHLEEIRPGGRVPFSSDYASTRFGYPLSLGVQPDGRVVLLLWSQGDLTSTALRFCW